ncbi:mitochondrial protein [Paraphysoderma sedebokerense]|nr:mitochondrial protein [Paraphysoderma sedebokerense]
MNHSRFFLRSTLLHIYRPTTNTQFLRILWRMQNQQSKFTTTAVSLSNSIPSSHFDTYKFVQKLEQEGFTREQSESIMTSFSEVVNESMQNLTKNMVSKSDQEKNVHMYKVDFTQLKSEIKMLEKNDFAILKGENERLVAEVEKLKLKMREEMNRLQAGVRLDMNLEKGRIRDEASVQEGKIREADARIETEISNIRTQLESIKYEIIRNIVGTITAAGGLILAYLRFLH